MDLARSVYSRDLKIASMRALDAGSSTGEIARKYQLSPKLLERWRGEWRAKGEMAFPGIGRRGADLPALDDSRRIAELERKIGQLTMENDFLKKALQHSCIWRWCWRLMLMLAWCCFSSSVWSCAAYCTPRSECRTAPARL